ncbi:hypothetical protein QA646_19010 (plasmid) [Rhizobium sp. CB3090]|uniref:hypothetical protein n=1 Tax=Rhizobium sp. CB3090 TaxID=3039156 RepID=UPI0024B1F31C|nr:hypothetical protein [Rhizobium sp. CB3090]WFU12036.1 hypothetical protein QA646_19010 [Rhizobium sp. CB3090]
MSERLASFIALSSALTGFNAMKLHATDLAETYLGVLDQIVPTDIVNDLLDSFRELPANGDGGPLPAILRDPQLGPIARNVIMLWYCGTWQQLPEGWRTAFGASPLDKTHLVSGAAYQAGLQWLAAGAHPPGAKQQGFGAWALAPAGGRHGERDVL